MDTITGTVVKTNGNGFRIAEQDGWLNFSKFAKPTPTMPTVGEHVSITLDKSGYVRAVEVVQPAPAHTGHGPIDRETAITRMACLNTATAVLSSGGRADVGAVLSVAAQLEAWVYRS